MVIGHAVNAPAVQLEALPLEILDDIVGRLPRWSQRHAAGACRKLYSLVIPQLYRSIELVNCRNAGTGDEHDDSPMIRMLLVLAQNSFLASQVRVVMHRCHLPLPDVFGDLPSMCFDDATLSRDPRTLRLLQLAIQNLINVHTLRIVLGHHNVVHGLILGFFGKQRPRTCSVRRLWLESSCLDGMEWDRLDSTGLESFRYRRAATVHEAARRDRQAIMYALTRRDPDMAYTDGYSVRTTLARSVESVFELSAEASTWDDEIYQAFPETSAVLARAQCSTYSAACLFPRQRCVDRREPIRIIGKLLLNCAGSLTSITLDWLFGLWVDYDEFGSIISRLTNLHALQFRNGLFDREGGARSPSKSFLFSDPWLTTLGKVTNMQCIAWGANLFLPDRYSTTGLPVVTRQIIQRLGLTLQSLRIDSDPIPLGEPTTESGSEELNVDARQRRLFLEHVAPEMRALEVIRVEGCIPYDERHELMRALKHCPLQKVVIIGVCYPGSDRSDFEDDDGLRTQVQYDQWDLRNPLPMPTYDIERDRYNFVREDQWAEVCQVAARTEFRPCYGRTTGFKSIIETIAIHHASTLTELKFCSFRNAPILHCLLLKTSLMFHYLKYLH